MDRKIAVVSGATKGIGLSISNRLVGEGYRVIGTYVNDYSKDVLNNLENDFFSLVKVDVRDYESCAQFSKDLIEKYGRIDALINNAGVTRDRLLMMMSPDDFDMVLDVNLKGTFNLTQVFTKQFMKQRHGAIVNITSVIGIVGNAGQSNYAASKAGVIGFTKSVAKELSARGIRVNCIAPGFIETQMTQALNEKVRADIENKIAMKRFGTGEDIANATAFLISDDSSYITGQVLNVCGGMVI